MDKRRIESLLEALGQGIFEKEHVLSLALLAAVAGESLFLLGPPGTGKSMLARRMKYAFRGGRSFEYLMSRFSTPDEIFGPVSVSALKDEDRYVRMTEGYLPTADVVFLDEIWKAGPSIQNALLTVLNEKVFLNGREELKLPLKLVVAASNELPAEGENLEALWDRFLVRCVVGGIVSQNLFNRMIAAPAGGEPDIPDAVRLSADELGIWSDGIDRVSLPDFVFGFVHTFRRLLTAYNASQEQGGETAMMYVSDRRWKKLVHLWRTAAFLNGRSEVCLADLLLAQCALWDTPAQEPVVVRLMTDALVDVCGERIGLPLLSERLAALKEEVRGAALPRVVFKLVSAFFYQVQSFYPGRTVLIYVDEYKELDAVSATPFVLVDNKRKTGVQILRKYDRNRHPGVFPKDLLQVVRTASGLQVNGRKYDLLQEDDEEKLEAAGAVVESGGTSVSPEMFRRVAAEVESIAAGMEEWQRQEEEHAARHLFLDDAQRNVLKNAIRRVRADITSLQIEIQELGHAAGHE